jgi:hypothetical protein
LFGGRLFELLGEMELGLCCDLSYCYQCFSYAALLQTSHKRLQLLAICVRDGSGTANAISTKI